LQRRIRALLEGLGLSVRDVCASNLIFQRSVSAEDLPFRSLAALCWPIHERIIEIVRPKVIITFGNGLKSPYSFVRDSLGATNQEAFPSGHGNWNCLVSFSQRATVVCVPHLSSYAIRSEVIAWIRDLVNG
jgi:uracil-DNA glycosylase